MEEGGSSAGYGSAGGQPERRALAKGGGCPVSWWGAVPATTLCSPMHGPLAQCAKLRGFGGWPPTVRSGGGAPKGGSQRRFPGPRTRRVRSAQVISWGLRLPWDRTGSDGIGRDRTGSGGIRRDQAGSDGIGRDRTGSDGIRRDQAGSGGIRRVGRPGEAVCRDRPRLCRDRPRLCRCGLRPFQRCFRQGGGCGPGWR